MTKYTYYYKPSHDLERSHGPSAWWWMPNAQYWMAYNAFPSYHNWPTIPDSAALLKGADI